MRTTGYILILSVVACSAVHAQAVFRSVMPDGKIIYGDKPAPGAQEAKQVNLPPANSSASPPSQTLTPISPNAAAAPGMPHPKDSVATARQNLEAAKKALDAGRDPQEGERIGTKRGASRTTEQYAERVKSLEDAVSSAQRQLDDAQRNAKP